MTSLRPEFVPPRAPNVYLDYSADEVAITKRRELGDNLRELERWSGTFSHCIALYAFSKKELQNEVQNNAREPNSVWFGWSTIAARSGVLAARNFGQTLEATSSVAKFFENLRSKKHLSAYAHCRHAFDTMFPGVDKARHSVAHPEYYPDTKRKMGSDADFVNSAFSITNSKNVKLQDAMINGVYNCTFAGEYLSCPITNDAALELVKITSLIYDSISPDL